MRFGFGDAFHNPDAAHQPVERGHVRDLDFRNEVPETVRRVKPRKSRILPQGRYNALHVAPLQLDHHDTAYPIGRFHLLQPHREPGNDPARDQAIHPGLNGAAGDTEKLGQCRNRGSGIDPKFSDQAVVEVVHLRRLER